MEPLVCVVVCVHNALPDVRQCLTSAKATDYPADRFHIVVVDDGSAHETKCFLEEFAAADNVTLIRHDAARGYTRAANEGIRARDDASFVVLLNSDTIVPPQWLRKMLVVFDTLPDVGIVGPLSNAATWQSVPDYRNDAGGWATNDLPANWSVARMDEFVHSLFAAMPRIPRIPVLNGFCLMIRSTVFDRIGLLDEQTFPRGYGEENDFCFRASDAGFGLAVATNCFVFHGKSKSFGEATRNELARLGREGLVAKFGVGRFNRATETMKQQPVLADIRAKVALGLQRDQLIANANGPAPGGNAQSLAAPAFADVSKAREINAAVQQIFDDGTAGVHEIDGNFALDVLEPASFRKHEHVAGSYPAGQSIEDGFLTGPVFALRALEAQVDTRAGLTLADDGVIRCTTVTSKLVKRYREQPAPGPAVRHGTGGMSVPLASLRMNNYCRWWLESISKLFIVSRSRLAFGEAQAAMSLKAVTPKLTAAFQRDSVDLLGNAFEFVEAEGALTRGLCINSSGLCYAGGQQIGAMTRDFSAFLSELELPTTGDTEAGPLVYVSRSQARTRRVLNEDAFLPALRKMGFAVVQLEQLPLAKQIEIFRKASLVVAPHGSGLANILFCRPGTRIVEIFPEGGVHGSAYLRIASHLNLDYYFAVAKAERTTADGDPVDADMVVDKDGLVGFIRDVVNTATNARL